MAGMKYMLFLWRVVISIYSHLAWILNLNSFHSGKLENFLPTASLNPSCLFRVDQQ